MKLDVGGFALAGAILWGVGVFILGLIGHFGWGARLVDVLGSVYIGYSTSIVGAVIGGIWGFFDALISGAIFAWIYNRVLAPRAPF